MFCILIDAVRRGGGIYTHRYLKEVLRRTEKEFMDDAAVPFPKALVMPAGAVKARARVRNGVKMS